MPRGRGDPYAPAGVLVGAALLLLGQHVEGALLPLLPPAHLVAEVAGLVGVLVTLTIARHVYPPAGGLGGLLRRVNCTGGGGAGLAGHAPDPRPMHRPPASLTGRLPLGVLLQQLDDLGAVFLQLVLRHAVDLEEDLRLGGHGLYGSEDSAAGQRTPTNIPRDVTGLTNKHYSIDVTRRVKLDWILEKHPKG